MNDLIDTKNIIFSISSHYLSSNNYIVKELSNWLIPSKKKLLNIDFNTQLIITKSKQDSFIKYDKNKKVFSLNVDDAKRKFDELSNMSNFNLYNVNFNNIYKNYTVEEISYLIKSKKMKFVDYIISEFYKELMLNIIDLSYGETINYKDDYVEYHEERGNFIKVVFAELFLRKFSQKYNLPYFPSEFDDNILKKLKIVFNEKNFSIILNKKLNDLYDKTNNIMVSNIINEYEEKMFEKKYKLKQGLLYNLELEFINQKSPYLRKYEIKKNLIEIKKNLENKNMNNSKIDLLLKKIIESRSTSSSGFANIVILAIFVSSLVLLGIFFALILLHVS